jgi:hypothetical protein
VPLSPQPGGHRQAAVGGQPVPDKRRLLPAKEAAQLAEGADQGAGVVGIDLVMEGDRCAAAA